MGQIAVALGAKIPDAKRSLDRSERTGVAFPRYFTTKLENGKTPYDEVLWETRTATIGSSTGAVVFEQTPCSFWLA